MVCNGVNKTIPKHKYFIGSKNNDANHAKDGKITK